MSGPTTVAEIVERLCRQPLRSEVEDELVLAGVAFEAAARARGRPGNRLVNGWSRTWCQRDRELRAAPGRQRGGHRILRP
jgi:hypothetical protein